MLFPMVSAAAGYLLDGVTSAASGPFILAWLLGTRRGCTTTVTAGPAPRRRQWYAQWGS